MSGKLSDGAGSFDVVIESVGDVVDPLRELAEMVAAVGDLDQGVDDSIRVDRLRLLEELKAAAAAAQPPRRCSPG